MAPIIVKVHSTSKTTTTGAIITIISSPTGKEIYH